MAKKFVLVLVFATIVAGVGFAADWSSTATWGGKKNFVSGTVNILGAGATYERFLAPKWSIGADAYLSWFFLWTDIEVGAFGRYYIWNGLFTEVGLGFHVQSYGLFGVISDNLIGGAITPGVGFKFDPGKPGRFFVETGIKIPITLGVRRRSVEDWWGFTSSQSRFGAGVGVVAYAGLGYAF